MHNQAAVDALVGADVVVIPLQGAEVKVKPTLALLEAHPTDTPRAVIAVSSISTWAKTPMNANGDPLTERDEPRRGVVPGAAKATADAERLILRSSSSLKTTKSISGEKQESSAAAASGGGANTETYVVCPGMLYGGGEFPDGFLAPMRAAWEGKPVPVFGSGNNRVPLCHAMNLAATVVSVAAGAMAGRGPPATGRYVLALDGVDDGGDDEDAAAAAGGGGEAASYAAPTQMEAETSNLIHARVRWT